MLFYANRHPTRFVSAHQKYINFFFPRAYDVWCDSNWNMFCFFFDYAVQIVREIKYCRISTSTVGTHFDLCDVRRATDTLLQFIYIREIHLISVNIGESENK